MKNVNEEKHMLEDIVTQYGFNLSVEEISKNKMNVEKRSYVYFLWLSGAVVYVGCTTAHPVDRMVSHRHLFEFKEISWISVPKELLIAIEWFYINKFDPPNNKNKRRPWLGPVVESYTGIPIVVLNGVETKNNQKSKLERENAAT